jgi:hypothetical protein
MPHRRQNKYQRPPIGYTPLTDPNQQAIRPPIGGVPPVNQMVPPPIVDAPPPGYPMYPLTPPIGGILPPSPTQPPLGANPVECCSFDPPLGAHGAQPADQPMQPPVGSQPATLIPSYPIKPPISGPPMPYRY